MGFSLVAVHGLLIAVVASLVAEHGLEGSWASVVLVLGFSCPKACGILLDRDQTHVPCIGRWILNHWTTREVLVLFFLETENV